MKTLVLTEYYLPITGGAQIILAEIVRRLPGETVLFTCPVPGQEAFDATQSYRIIRGRALGPLVAMLPELTPAQRRAIGEQRRIDHWCGRFRLCRWCTYLRVIVEMVRMAGRERPDAILCGQPFLAGVAARVYRWLTGAPYAVYTYGEELTMGLRGGRLGSATQRWVLAGASAVFAISEFSKRILEEFGVPPARIWLQHPAVCNIFFSAAPPDRRAVRSALNIASEAPILLTTARLMERKGVDTVIRALSEVLRACPGTVYLVAGTGADRPRLERLVREAGLEAHVRFLGDTPHADLVRYYHACDVFVMPNRTIRETGEIETFGMVFLEANACGKPVIGGREGGVVDAVEDGVSGLLVDPNNVQEVAQAIVKLLRDRQLATRLGEDGCRRAREQFSWDRNAADVGRALALAAAEAREWAGRL